MLQSKTYLFLISAVFFFVDVSAQEKYQAVNWNTEHGLIWGRLNTMLKDKEGFLWITSEFGLNRFDGNRFTSYLPDSSGPGTIAGTASHALIEDSANNIWIGTNKGLSRYDIAADTFTNFVADAENFGSYVTPFWASRKEVFCIDSRSRIISYNVRTFKKTYLTQPQTGPNEFADKLSNQYSVLDPSSNSVWVLSGKRDGLIQVSLHNGNITHHKRTVINTKIPFIFHAFNREAMCYDRMRNCIWISSDDGLIQFTLKDSHFHYTYALNPSLNSREYDHWGGIAMDRSGRIWLASVSKGIIIYDPSTNSLHQPLETAELQKEISEGTFYIYSDRDGFVWTGSWLKKGIHQLITSRQCVTRYFASELHPKYFYGAIPQVVPADRGRLWIASQDGLVILDQNTGSTEILRESDLPGIRGKEITPLIVDTTIQKAWLNAFTPDDPAAPDAIYEMDINTRTCRKVVHRDTANRVVNPTNIIFYTALKYKNGFIYLDQGNGIFMVDKDSAVARLIISTPRNGYLYIGDSGKIILKSFKGPVTYSDIDGKFVATRSPLDSIACTSLFFEKADHSWWVGGFRKLVHYDKDFRIIHKYDRQSGLPELNVHRITPDDFGNIWFHSEDGVVSMLNRKTGEIVTLSERDGFHKQFFQWQPTFVRDNGGILYFAGNEGIDRIDPGKLVNYPPSSAYLYGLNVNQKPYASQAGLNNIQKLSLRYFENSITIETGVIDYYSKGKNRIRYKLHGSNDTWEYAPANYTIRFNKLPHGSYTLFLQAANASNEFNGPIKSLVIHISPAFWNTWWFRVMAVLLAAGIFYGVIRWRVHQRFMLQLERTEKEKQWASFQQQKTELEMQALRAQMNPHFIFNSLNSINRYILQNNKVQASEYLTKFSKLVRMILQNSREALITLENELEALKLYLELEALRFENRFDFKISVPKDLDTDVVKVPPLIIQPYVENAIWHGLMHKEEKGHLAIDAANKDNYLFLKIGDNGIGRKQASQLARKSTVSHKSMGLKITADRITNLHGSNGAESPVTITDLVHADGSAAGTEVMIKLPLLYD